ncbi:ABC transporter ATP-binding protein/permease [Methylovirgula sp. 4M-Z18]|uniref:ABC transporter ATP-binding protein/permease n=1 Tax=Methylovirgula sp. 4M-Z18 TaxID=2293567 RepID=UPI000E2FC8FF|nr:ABC transporter ATP-binding protein/permease [Methylovirgula sp. 4M-Z18]RFB75646.1 ABC transporter ATP-binding protein/permease [Methylovirgula sp. 4M-Z18]
MNVPAKLPQPVATHIADASSNGVWAQLLIMLEALKGSPRKWVLISLPAGSVVVISAIAVGQVRLNQWQGALYDTLVQRNFSGFLHQTTVFLAIVSALLALVVAQTWLTEVGKVRLRGWLVRDVMDEWLRPKRAYLFAYTGESGVNPDQRIHEDARHLSELSVDFGNGLLQSSLLLISFVGVLWGLSSQVVFNWDGKDFTIPGYMVWCAFAYASVGSWLTWWVGRPLIQLNADHYAREAAFRTALVRVVERAEAIVLYRGEADERAWLDDKFNAVQIVARKLAGGVARLTWITSGHGWLAILAPFLIAAPGYFSGRLSLGALMITVGAFNQVQSSLRWFVDNFSRIADWRATLGRVVTMREALRALETLHENESRIDFSEHPEQKLVLEHVETFLPGSLVECAVLNEERIELCPGEHVQVIGDVTAVKTTFFLALAGLWPWGRGTISLPPRDDMMFLPRQPYLPTGSLRSAIAYPAEAHVFSDEAMRAALSRVELGHLADDLDRKATWEKELSLDEEQALGFARVLLHAPKWVFLDDALGAMDPKMRASIMSTFGQELAGTSVVSTGRSAENGFYSKTLHLRRLERQEKRSTPLSVDAVT